MSPDAPGGKGPPPGGPGSSPGGSGTPPGGSGSALAASGPPPPDVRPLPMGRTREGVVFRIHVHPHARRQEVVGVRGEALAVKVTAPAEGGQANEACRRLLASILDVPAERVEIIRGRTARHKVVLIHGLAPGQVADGLKECLHK